MSHVADQGRSCISVLEREVDRLGSIERRLRLELQVERCAKMSAERALRLEREKPKPELPDLKQVRRNRDYSTTLRILGCMPNSQQWLCHYLTTGKTVWRDTQFLLEFYPFVVSR